MRIGSPCCLPARSAALKETLQQTLEQGVQATGTDVLGLFVDLPGDLGDALDAVLEKLDVQPFGLQQLAVLLGERRMRLGEDALEVLR